MIAELAFVNIHPGTEKDFRTALSLAVDEVLSKSRGFVCFHLRDSLHEPSRYCFEVEWETKENYTDGFRNSEAFTEWRKRIGSFFAEPPFCGCLIKFDYGNNA
jgi:heme-degrading monooxygenase HmoA